MDLTPILIIVLTVLAVVVMAAIATRRRSRPGGTHGGGVRPAAPPSAPPRLRSRLQKTRAAVADRLASIAGKGRPDDHFWADVEDALVAADVGVGTTIDLVAAARDRKPVDHAAARRMLQEELERVLVGRHRELDLEHKPAVVLVVGVNGGGKTTSVAKLAAYLQRDGSAVLLGSADTFRAAADRQLRTWADRLGVDIVGGEVGADSAAVAFDAYHAARARGVDVLIVDTAGRLQSRSNLMDELAKVARVLRTEAEHVDEVLLVIDGTTGQNALAQARVFTGAVGVTGIVITKLDGTARGGVAVAIERELDIPVKFIGVGEGVEDLVPFRPDEFVDALLGS